MTPEIVAAWMTALGGRRFLMTMGAASVNTVLFVCHTLSENGYLMAFYATIGAYIGANTIEGFKGIKTNGAPSTGK